MTRILTTLGMILCAVAWHFGLCFIAGRVARTDALNAALPYFAAFAGTVNGLWASWLHIDEIGGRVSYWIGFLVVFVVLVFCAVLFFLGLPLAMGEQLEPQLWVTTVNV